VALAVPAIATSSSAGTQAGSSAAQAAGNVGSSSANTFTVASADRYWTPDRMARATPVELPVTSTPGVQPRSGGKPQRVDGARPAGFTTQAVSIQSMTGRIFFVDDRGQDRSCTGSTVNSAGKRLVFTAGHCVHGGGAGHGFFDVNKWVFVPNYQGGSPYGTWNAYQLFTKDAWIKQANRAYDVAAVVMKDKDGKRIVDAVGGQGIEWNKGYGLNEYMFGYPADPPYNGSGLFFCKGATSNDGGFPALDCKLTGGASGGPWLDQYGSPIAYVNGVSSWMFWKDNDVSKVYKWQSPYFNDDTAGSLFNFVQNM
jgi:hypothetical protein